MKTRTPLTYKLLGVRAGSLLELYRYRLRNHVIEEILAGAGIAVGVALVFGVLLANTSITSQASELIHSVVGTAKLELSARSSQGFSERIAEAAGRLPAVQVASPILREDATITGPGGRQRVQLIGVTASLTVLESEATRNLGAGTLILSGGLGLPSSVADRIGARSGHAVQLTTGGLIKATSVRAVLGSQTIGPMAESPVVVALLPTAQKLTGYSGRVTEVFIKPKPGMQAAAAQELSKLADGRLNVTSAGNELRLLDEAAQPVDQSTTLFAAVGAVVGGLLALNAILLTVPDRRRFVAEIRRLGYTRRQIIVVLAYQAIILGLLSSGVGIGLGYVLSHVLFHEVPLVLTFAFPISSHQHVNIVIVLAAIASGVCASLGAQLPPVLDLRSRTIKATSREFGEPGQGLSQRTVALLGLGGVVLTASAIAIAFVAPSLTIVGGMVLVVAVLCLAPGAVWAVGAVLYPVGDRLQRSMLPLAVTEVRATATRSIVVVGIAALAVYGSVAMQGARNDLIHGLDNAVTDYLDTASIWVTTSNNTLNVDPIQLDQVQSGLLHISGVVAVRAYQGGLLDIGSRRLWLRARAPSTPQILEPSQVLSGNLAVAMHRLREGGWIALSSALANELHLGVGDRIGLPTPSGIERFTIAAITTNIGWTPGAVTIDTSDYQHYWHSATPTALEVELKSGYSSQVGKEIVERVVHARDPGLLVQALHEREAVYRASVRQGLKSLGQISNLLLVASALAIAATLSAAIRQRRAHLATLKAQGFVRHQLWRALLIESAILLVCGSVIGVTLGILGHALASRWLQATTGFPAPFSLGGGDVLFVLLVVAGIALVVVAIPGYAAAKVAPRPTYQW